MKKVECHWHWSSRRNIFSCWSILIWIDCWEFMCKNISMSSMRYKYLNLGMSTLEWVIGIGKQNCLISYFLPHFGSCFIIHANLPLATQGLVKCGVVYNKISNIIILPDTSIISHFPIKISCPPLCKQHDICCCDFSIPTCNTTNIGCTKNNLPTKTDKWYL